MGALGVALAGLAVPVPGGGAGRRRVHGAQPGAIGRQPVDLAYLDVAGGRHSLRSRIDLPAAYLFVSTECPVAAVYAPRIRALAARCRTRGVRFVLVYPNAADTRAEAREHARSRGFTCRVVKDDGTLASALGATMVPEAVVLDRDGALCYRGRIDDSTDPARVRSRDLARALDAVLAGQPVRVSEAPGIGCVIQSAAPRPGRAVAGPTYAANVAPILYRNCLPCHRSGEVAPFSMETYRETAAWARQIAASTSARRMPPWKAESHGQFLDERRLTDAQIATLRRWAEAGAPAGDLTKLPPKPAFPPGWRLGEPDALLRMGADYTVGPDGPDVYRCFVYPTGYAHDRFISAMEVHPGNRRIVHHVIAWLDTSGRAEKLDAADPGAGYTSTGGFPGFIPAGFLGGWAPGNEARFLPDGVGVRLPAGSRVVLEVHYTRTGKDETDRTSVGLHFSRSPVRKALRVLPVANLLFRIPAGDPAYVVRATAAVRQDITVLSVMPHMHLLGRSIDVMASRGRNKPETPLVRIPDWDFNWQLTYVLKEPVRLPRGSVVKLRATYDNTEGNPRNPYRPPRDVTWGEQTRDEMDIAFVSYTIDDEDLTQGHPEPGRQFGGMSPDGG